MNGKRDIMKLMGTEYQNISAKGDLYKLNFETVALKILKPLPFLALSVYKAYNAYRMRKAKTNSNNS